MASDAHLSPPWGSSLRPSRGMPDANAPATETTRPRSPFEAGRTAMASALSKPMALPQNPAAPQSESPHRNALPNSTEPGELGQQPSTPGVDAQSLAEVYRECAPAIYRMMLRLGIPERYAEDATNDVFVTALPRWSEFRGDSSRRTWLFGFALKIAANQRRKLGRAGEETALALSHDFEASPSAASDPFEHVSARQAIQQLESVLNTLSLEERALWLLVYYEDVSVSDAAQIVGISTPKAYCLAKWVHAKLIKAWKRQNPPDAWRTW